MKKTRKNKTIEEMANDFLAVWSSDDIEKLLVDVTPLPLMYSLDKDNNWIRDAVGNDDYINIMLIRTIYIISRLSEFHTGKLLRTQLEFPGLWRKMEKEAKERKKSEVLSVS